MNSEFGPSATIEILKQRAATLNQVRDFFDTRGFFHVETPALSSDVVVDRHIHPIWLEKHRVNSTGSLSEFQKDSSENSSRSTTDNDCEDKERQSTARQKEVGASFEPSPLYYLQTSPEFHMKRLLASGADKIYQISRVFRAGEAGTCHNPEFTMLEWYRTGDNQEEGIQLLSEFASEFLNREIEAISYRDLFYEHFKLDPIQCPTAQLIETIQQNGQFQGNWSSEDERDELLNVLMAILEPQLGLELGLIVYDWPASQAALANVRFEDGVAERFELFVDGIELANGYHELLDPDELRNRNRTVNQQRLADGNSELPESSRLLDAMEAGLPQCAGVALGLDRLLMVALGKQRIADVVAFPINIA